MPIYDVKCEKCEKILEDQWLKIDEEPIPCECGGKMIKQCGGRFKLEYNNSRDVCGWAHDGYQSTMKNKTHDAGIDWSQSPAYLPNS